MFSLIKFFVFFVVVVAGGMLAFNKFPSLREHALAIINPTAAREQQVTNELQENLAKADTAIQNIASATTIQDIKKHSATAQSAINASINLDKELATLQKDDQGIIGSTISTVAKALSNIPGISLTTPTPSVSASPLVCPPVK